MSLYVSVVVLAPTLPQRQCVHARPVARPARSASCATCLTVRWCLHGPATMSTTPRHTSVGINMDTRPTRVSQIQLCSHLALRSSSAAVPLRRFLPTSLLNVSRSRATEATSITVPGRKSWLTLVVLRSVGTSTTGEPLVGRGRASDNISQYLLHSCMHADCIWMDGSEFWQNRRRLRPSVVLSGAWSARRYPTHVLAVTLGSD